ncbi:hypothetical protein MNB_SV-15-1192 [hydrothermal vent metagenome]|uniref:Uncharacterized protein n=1 Tax=hydrothermal vent metagenome TaxID=652676 RepID=A0A1W1ELH1_9ZZZZ
MRRTRVIKKKSNRGIYLLIGILVLFIIPLFIEKSRIFILGIFWRVLFFFKKHIISIFISFFLVKGKFIFILFLKKLTILTTMGLSKRYVTEKIFIHNLKKHFLRHLKEEQIILKKYITKSFQNSPIIQKILTVVAFLASLSFVTKFMGLFLALKVIIARIWSILLAIFLKIGATTAYFFTDYLWNSILAPLIELIIFTWFLELLEKIPTINRWLQSIYKLFLSSFQAVERVLEKTLHIPFKKFLAMLVRKIQLKVRKLEKSKIDSIREKIIDKRLINPNIHKRIELKREIYLKSLIDDSYKSKYQELKNRRESFQKKS